jgi:hypothetical protein
MDKCHRSICLGVRTVRGVSLEEQRHGTEQFQFRFMVRGSRLYLSRNPLQQLTFEGRY